jgi:mono/diheme cytochrome c family protein
VVTQVTNGKNAMPAFGGRLSDDGALILKSQGIWIQVY